MGVVGGIVGACGGDDLGKWLEVAAVDASVVVVVVVVG